MRFFFGGPGGGRTRVQTGNDWGFYMLIISLIVEKYMAKDNLDTSLSNEV